MAQLICQRNGRTLEIDGTLRVTRDWVTEVDPQARGVEEYHAKIFREDSVYYLEGLQGYTEVTGAVIDRGDKVKLDHNGVILFGSRRGGAIFIFKDFVQSRKLRDTRRLQTMRMENLKSAAEQFAREFFSQVPSTLSSFAEYLLDFMFLKFRASRGVLYEVRDRRWIPLKARAMSPKFVPPKSILKRVWDNKEPERFSLKDVAETSELSKSIVDNQVQSAICFPMVRARTLMGVLYIDTQEDNVVLSQDDLIVLCAIMPGIGAYLHALLDTERRRAEVYRGIEVSFLNSDSLSDLNLEIIKANKNLDSLSFARKGKKDSSFLFFIKIFGQTREATYKAMVYAGISALLEAFDLSDDLTAIFDAMNLYFNKFPALKISFCCAHVRMGKLTLKSQGEANMVMKCPEAPAFASGRGQFDLSAGTFFLLSGEKPDFWCGIFDRIVYLRICDEVKLLKGGLFGRVGVIDEKK